MMHAGGRWTGLSVLAAAGALAAAPAMAQVAPDTIPDIRATAPVPQPTPAPAASPTAGPRPTPTPSASPTPAPTAERPAPVVAPAPRTTPTEATTQAREAPRPPVTETPTPTPTPTPTASATIAPTATPSPQPESAATPPAAPQSMTELPYWALPAAVLWLVAIVALAVGWRRRRRRLRADEPVERVDDPVAEPAAAPLRDPAPVPAPRYLDPEPSPAPAPAATAQIDIDEPTVARAGLNLVTATADVTVVVRNNSPVVATGVALDVRLTCAQPGQDAAIAGMFAGPVEKPATPRFDLAPGESRRVRTLVTLQRGEITVLQAGGRPMFVPVLAIRAAHAGGQTISVHAIGIVRPDQAKLGPFWLDQPIRTYDTIGVRPHNMRG